MSKSIGLAVLLAASIVLLATGCGSDSDEGEETETTETSAGNERLTTEQWSAYEAVATPLEAASADATKKLNVCISAANDADQLETCVGDSFSTLADATAAYATTLTGFQGTVGGACEDALAELLNYARPFQASAEKLQQVIDDGDLAAYTAASSNLEVAATGGREEKTGFEATCKPA